MHEIRRLSCLTLCLWAKYNVISILIDRVQPKINLATVFFNVILWSSLSFNHIFHWTPYLWYSNLSCCHFAGEPSIPCGSCGNPCTLRTANTESNRGKKFYSCQGCNFFMYVCVIVICKLWGKKVKLNILKFRVCLWHHCGIIAVWHSD